MKKSSRVTAHASPRKRVLYVTADILMTNAQFNISRDAELTASKKVYFSVDLFRLSSSVSSCFFWGSSGLFHPRVGLSIIYFDRRSRVPVLFPEEAQTHIFLSFGKQEMENLVGKCLQEKKWMFNNLKIRWENSKTPDPLKLDVYDFDYLNVFTLNLIFQDVEFSIPQL